MANIHPTAVIDPSAEVADDVRIGPFCVIGKGVKILSGNVLMAHVVVGDHTTLGRNNYVHPFASVGGHPQSYDRAISDDCRLEIGENNTIYESCTINRGTEAGGGVTTIGSNNLLMAYVHIGHDCHIGDHAVLINHATLGGHVILQDYAVLSAFVAIRQCCVVGTHAFVTRASKVSKDVLAYTIVQGNPPKMVGINKEGLKRRAFSADDLDVLSTIYRTVVNKGLTLAESIEAIETMPPTEFTKTIASQLRESERGIVR